MDAIQKELLLAVTDLHDVPEGAYNIRANGTSAARNTTANIDIITKTDKQGIDIIIKPDTKNESVHIPVLLSESGLEEMVYNDRKTLRYTNLSHRIRQTVETAGSPFGFDI